MKAFFVWAGLVIATLVAIVFLSIFFTGLDFGLNAFFMPKQEQVRRNTFEQSQAYNEGMRRDLESICNDYRTTNDATRKAILVQTFTHRVEGYPNQLPDYLQSCRDQMEHAQ